MDTVLLQKIQKAKILLQPSQSTITAIGLQQGIASYAQERVWFVEKLQNDSSTSLTSNNVVLPLVVKCGSISIERIRSSILTILNQHTILRTAFDFNEKRGKLMQKVQSNVGIHSYSFEVTRRTILSTNEMVELIKNEFDNNFSDLDLGLVLRCHLVKMGLNDDYELLKPDDLIIFVFHQIVFDYNSIGPFIAAFTQAYDEVTSNMTNLQYIDYTLYEQTQLASGNQDSNISKAKQFWSTVMHDYKPYVRNSSSTTSMNEMKKRCGRGLSATFNLDSYTVGAQIEFASLYNVSMFDLGLACYFIFLYELNNGTINDLCVVCPTANRPLTEMKSIIGTFINMLPYRIRIDPNQSFINFVQRLHTLCADISEHDQLPYQLIMKDTDNSYLPKLPFHFRFDSIDPLSAEEMALESKTKDGTLGLYVDGVWLHGNGVMANDLTLTMIHNHHEQKTQYIFECSTDCYEEKAADKMCRHFEDFLSNFFIKSSTTSDFNNTKQSITSSSHLLSGIKQLSKANFEQQSIIAETSFSTGSNLKTDEKCSLAPKEDILKIASNNKLEDTINNIWHEVMHTELDSYKTQQNDDSSISTTTSFFSLGGDSLPLLQLYRSYQSIFHFDTDALSIRTFFEHDTLAEHAKLLKTAIINDIQSRQWHTLHINQGIASFAQERIFLDEQVRFSNKIAIYNELVVVRPVKGSLSMARLLEAIRAVLEKNNILRTCLILDNSENKLKQCVTDHHQTFTFANEQTFETDNELSDLIYKGKVDRSRFDLSNGRIFDCQILRKQQSFNSNYDTERITDSDVLIFGFHHTVCDRLSFQNFLKSLSRAYNNKKAYADEKQSLQYIDYTVLERVMDMTLSREFWHSQLDGYNFKYPFPFTVDRHRLPNDQRSGVASTAQIAFDDDIASSFLNYASTHHLTFFQLGLAIFYVFLFKLSHGLTDLCVSCLNANRYKSELQDMIGMFVSTLPHRLQLDSSCSFDELVKHVRDQCLSILEHSHYPLQHILADFHLNRSNVSFLETLFDFITVSPNFDQPSFDGIILGEAPLNQSYEVAKFDFSMTFFYNSTSDDHKLCCSLVCSSEIFDEATVKILSRRFNYLVEQLVSSNPSTKRIHTYLLSISNTDLILPEEANEIQNIDFCRQLDVLNDAPASYAQTRLWFKERSNPDIGNLQVPSYNMPFVYRLYPQRTLSKAKLSIALQLIVKKHPSLHTALTFHSEKQQLMQQIINHNDNQTNKMYFPFIISTYETDQQLQQIIFDENKNSQLFDLSQGLGFRCHLVYHQETSSDDGLLSDKDLIIFNFHHAFFDLQSLDIFLDDLNQAYVAGQLCTHGENDETVLRYLDYALIEQQMSMSGASFFWLDTLHDCQLERTLALPYDRYRLSNQQRTNRAISLTFDSDQHLSHRLLTCASTNNISLEHLILSLYFLFLYKITSGQKDLCIAIDTHGRYRPEFNSIIGVFVNTIPLRCQLHAHWSFIQFVDHVCEITRNSIKYSYYPLQHILNQHPHLSHAAFLHTSFEFIVSPTTGKHRNTIIIGDNQLSLLPLSFHNNENEIISKLDFIGSFIHNPMTNQLSCTMNASLDLFTCETIQTMTQRFHFMLHHLFSSNDTGRSDTAICELSFTMPHEQLLLQSLNNTQTISSPVTTEHCIHQTFAKQVIKHPQKLAVELDEQSLTYAELLHSAQILSLCLLNWYSVFVGDIVCQCVERSITMVIGIMAIEMTGSAYCPLSPRDPHHRLQSLAKQTHSRLVLVHWLTNEKFHDDVISLDIEMTLISNSYIENHMNFDSLSNITVTSENIAYVIFTSGSTGTPKAVQVSQGNFIHYAESLTQINSFNSDDVVIQMARCSFDMHMHEIIGIFILGGTLVMLHPHGTLDFDYLKEVLEKKQISYMHSVPSLLFSFFTYVEQSHNKNISLHLRSLISGGEPFPIQFVDILRRLVIAYCTIWNSYGPAEATIACTGHIVNLIENYENVPIGPPLPQYRCLILDEFDQAVVINEEGELIVGGVGVFIGYLHRDDLTSKALVYVDNELFYRTGDLVHVDHHGFIHYRGRKDHQIKIHGQRIELGEIEQCLLLISSISACIVVKWTDDNLISYIQSLSVNEQELRDHCQSHLPSHMIPSYFIILDKLPLNTNGKIDRKSLPAPHFSSSSVDDEIQFKSPSNDIEIIVHNTCCDIFQQKSISINTNLFTLGAHSLLMIQLFHRYKTKFQLYSNSFSITDLFQHPTIYDHAQIIHQTLDMTQTMHDSTWFSLHLTQANASYAQERIFLDEQIRFTTQTSNHNMYVIPLLYRVSSLNNQISLTRLHHALQNVITKHRILQTALYLDTNGILIQHCSKTKSCSLSVDDLLQYENCTTHEAVKNIMNQPSLFDLSTGDVINCHILRSHRSSSSSHNNNNQNDEHNDDRLNTDDLILFTIHHAFFDGTSTSVFIRDLSLAYSTSNSSDSSPSINLDPTFQYIDYSVHEHLIDMTTSQQFWSSQLHGFDFQHHHHPSLLCADRERSSPSTVLNQRSGSASIASFSFDQRLCTSFINYASQYHLTLFQLALATFYVFLFRLSHCQTDLCIASINSNRYRSELQNMIGMFVATLPYRLQLDRHCSFNELVRQVRNQCLSILPHSHYPLQHLLADFHLNQSNVSFLEIMFDFINISSNRSAFRLDETPLEQISLEQSDQVAKFDFSLHFVYDATASNDEQLSCVFICSSDLFDERTVRQISVRFQYLFEQLFASKERAEIGNVFEVPISSFNLILPEEASEIDDVKFSRQVDVINEAPASYTQARIWLEDSKSEATTHHMPFVYHFVSSNTISTKQLQNALQLCVGKHQSLHTSLNFDTEKNQLMQRVIDSHETHNGLFTFIESTYETDEQLYNIIHEEKHNSQLFHLARGLVFRCHVVYYKQLSFDGHLSDKDVLIFNFHHAVFDLPSMNLFLHDLNQAYTTDQLLTNDNDNNTLRYLDYALIERQMSMNGASRFWLDTLHDCNINQPLSLPYDRHRLIDEHRTNNGTSVSFHFNQDLSYNFLSYALLNNTTPEQLALAMYYAFLFKITNGEKDLSIGISTDGRYRNELKSIIGVFGNIIPLRCEFHHYWSCHQLIEHVKEMSATSMKYSYFPLQHIFDQHSDTSKLAALSTSFEYISSTLNIVKNETIIDNSRLCLMPFTMTTHDNEMMSKFDFILKIEHDCNINQLSCTINASLDVFKLETVHMIQQRWYSMLEQLFTSVHDLKMNKSIYELSLQLPEEQFLTQSMNNTQTSISFMSCIHQKFSYQVMKHPQKLAAELDNQSLTYTELLHYAQILSLNLLKKHFVKAGDIICQCVDRSLSMVIGMMAIEMTGGVYCPLSPRDPRHRLHALVQQTQARVVLVNFLTRTKFHNEIIQVDFDTNLIDYYEKTNTDFEQLSNVSVTSDNIAYVIFTSGSTGTPKAVQIRHRNFVGCIQSLLHIGLYTSSDIVMQMASCSYDVHVQEILGTLIIGSNLVFLHPEGNMDVEYVVTVLKEKQITYMQSVPAYLSYMCDFLVKNDHPKLETLRTLDIGGDKSTVQLFEKLYKHILKNARIVHLYGPAETTIDCTYHFVDMQLDKTSAPIGRSLPSYKCMILDEFLQQVLVHQDGELYVGGVGVFAGYLGHNELTGKALLVINGEIFYRTGDLVMLDKNNLLHHRGRKDYQVKLHGQRIELGEIEKCLLSAPISACIVTKWNDSQLVAYIQSSTIDDKQIREHCQTYLPSHMIPSKFIILEQLPLNANGKVDRKQLPSPKNLIQFDNYSSDAEPLTPLEERLCRIFSEAFHSDSPDVNTSFGHMGGTSLDAIRALWLIRKEICNKIDASTLFLNPSVRQLAKAIEPLLIILDESSVTPMTQETVDEKERPMPSLCIELIGIILIIAHGLSPLWSLYYFNFPIALIFIPVFHLLSYVVCQRLMFLQQETVKRNKKLYSWQYYRWWFLNSLWLTNNSYWLQHLIGTPFYNFYLRLCGAKIGCHAHIYTTLIDAPWLIEVGESTFIGEEVVFSNLSYQDQTYELHPIYIGSHCSVNTRSILYDKVIIEDHVYVEPMSAITGHIMLSSDRIVIKDRSISLNQTIYQFICLVGLFFIHSITFFLAYCVYRCFVILSVPLPIRLTLIWLVWSLMSILIVLLLLKFIVRSVTIGHYKLNSYYYLHKFWLRQLIVTSFSHSLDLIPEYEAFAPIILRWLGARIENDVKFSEFRQILYFPSNLLSVDSGVTTFLGAKLLPYEMTREGLCCFDHTHLSSNATLGNWCTIMPGAQFSSGITVSSLSLVTRETVNMDANKIFLGIPAREMPFAVVDNTSAENDLSFYSNSFSISALLIHIIIFFIIRCATISLYILLPASVATFMLLIIFCIACRYFIFIAFGIKHKSSDLITLVNVIILKFVVSYWVFFAPYLSGTQFFVFIFRVMGAKIGYDVILNGILCLTDPFLTSIGNHVRLQMGAHIVCHSFEQRLSKFKRVTVNDSSILMSNVAVYSGSTLGGQNRLLPLTFVMKNDLLQPNTNWYGVPAQKIV